MSFKDFVLNSSAPYLSPVGTEVFENDLIFYLNDMSYDFTIIIKNANTIIYTSSATLVYDVSARGIIRLPAAKSMTERLEHQYAIYIYLNDDITLNEELPRIKVS